MTEWGKFFPTLRSGTSSQSDFIHRRWISSARGGFHFYGHLAQGISSAYFTKRKRTADAVLFLLKYVDNNDTVSKGFT